MAELVPSTPSISLPIVDKKEGFVHRSYLMFYKVKAFFMQGDDTINMIVGELSHHSQQISSNRLSQGTYQKVPIFLGFINKCSV